jgi:ubiquinone/menaquinone biosynthesis C-methylase UbiE
VDRAEVIMPGGVELTLEAERTLNLAPGTSLLSVACGTGELELYLADKYGCRIDGVDVDPAFVAGARRKAAARGLDHRARFAIGDGSALPYRAGAFGALFCSGALCAFFEAGLGEFRRVLAPGGRAAILEVVWLREPVPDDVARTWSGGSAELLTVEGNCWAFERRGFEVLHARGYDEPSWWEAYYADRGDAPNWQEERAKYRAHRRYLGVGVFVLARI